MGTPKILMVLKYIIVISFIGISTYALYPFINGMGCDYRSQVDDENGSFYSTCKLGFVTTIAKNKQSNEVIEYHGLYGKTGHTIIFFAYNTSVLEAGVVQDNLPVSKLHMSPVFISKIIVEEDYDWVILGFPFSRVHKAKRVGPLSFW
ncbi:TPA: hypothetical protein PKO72_003771 [Aeromonas hydrophila]|uniref:hypothetical protein n=1 Tax=Aeromonas hydrophila TaxID=644 RepID=UPI001CCD8529|nr:hypothetical protein [Aeromonas hydrophila]UBQ49545.1 hypothetical protein LCH17_16930 [Aeromonas hydrophila]HDI1214988.1 hypothetical protein [Aeromonas hydrophila]